MPRMPELSKAVPAWDWKKLNTLEHLGVEVDWARYAYKDRVREARRAEEVAKARNGSAGDGDDDVQIATADGKADEKTSKRRKTTTSTAWSAKHSAKDLAASRREKKAVKRVQERRGKMSAEERARDAETRAMIEAVRKRGVVGDDTFGGFDD